MMLKIMLVILFAVSIAVNLFLCGASAYKGNSMDKLEKRKKARLAMAARKSKNRRDLKGRWQEIDFKAQEG